MANETIKLGLLHYHGEPIYPTTTPQAIVGIADYVVDTGTIGSWKYRKWESGIAEYWLTEYSFGMINNLQAYGNLFFVNFSFSFPTGAFIEIPFSTVQMLSQNALLYGSLHNTSKDGGQIYVASSTQNPNSECKVNIFSIGKWK